MQDFEKIGLFYLGRRYDASARKTTDDLILYDSKDRVDATKLVKVTTDISDESSAPDGVSFGSLWTKERTSSFRTHERIAIIPRRVEVLFDGPRADPADEIQFRSGLVVRA